MTPDELRELLIPNTAITSDEVRRRISAAADAWDLALVARYAIEEKYRALVKRLEAAEKELDKLDGKGVTELWCDRDWDYVTLKDGTRVSFYVYHKPAALAGEEKPSA